MNHIIHERPGVYSSYDASTIIRGGRAVRTIGVAAKSSAGTKGVPVTLTSYEAGLTAFGEDAAEAQGMSTILRLLFLGGASTVVAVAVDGEDYAGAFSALETVEDVQVIVCDSGELTVHQALRTSVDDALDSAGKPLSGVFAAAAVAAAVAVTRDPAVPLNGTRLPGLGGVGEQYGDNEVDLLVRGGVTPLEALGGVVSPVRGITTRTTTGGAQDITWRELTTILIVDDVVPSIRQSLRSRFSQTKNTVQTRGAIRSQVIVELESKLRAETIDSYGDVSVSVYDQDPTVCLVEFSFAVAHGLNQIYLTAHITI